LEVVAEGIYPLNFSLDRLCPATVWIILTRTLKV